MANEKQVDILRDGVDAWNQYRETLVLLPDLVEAKLSDSNLIGVNLSGANLSGANLSGANLSGANLSGANLSGANLSGANLSGANLSGANLAGANLAGANLAGANLSEANLSETNLRRASLIVAKLSGANLAGANLSEANLSEANLRRASLIGANLIGADLTGAKLALANLNRAALMEATLIGANLTEAGLVEANLIGAKLIAARLGKANLSLADLSRTDLMAADLSGANLVGAKLIAAHLGKANLSNADLSGADLDDASLEDTVLGNVKLVNVTGLATCLHFGPSTVDHRTLAQSGTLPPRFLRGCGLPDTLIDYLPSLLNRSIQFYSCFISYSTTDQSFADRLHADLQSKGVRCWFAPHSIQGGKKIHEQIDEAIRLYDRLLLILSEASMASEWVKTEIANARQKEIDQGKRVLFPIGLVPFETVRTWKNFDADTGKDSAGAIREYFIPDFSDWKKSHDAYQAAFGRLLRDLGAKVAVGTPTPLP